MDIPGLTITMPGVLSLNASGHAQNALDYKRLKARLKYEGNVVNPGIVEVCLENSR